MNIDELLAKLAAITDLAETENRSLTDDEIASYDELETQLKAAQKTVELRSRTAAYQAPGSAQAAALQAAVHLATKEDDTEARAFDSYLRTGVVNTDLESRAQGEGSPAAGGVLVPESFQAEVIKRLASYGGVASAAREIVTGDGRKMTWPTVDDVDNFTATEIVEENGTFSSGADVTWGSASLDVYTYAVGGAGGTPLRVSKELIQDSAVDIQGYIADLLAERIARLQAVHFATGNGVGQPKGLVHGLTGVEIADDTKGITYDDLVNWTHSVDPIFRANSVWVLPDAVIKRIKLIKDSHGDPVFRSATADLATGTGGDTILGYRVVVAPELPDITVNSNVINFGAFGDISRGYIVRRVLNDFVIDVNPYNRMSHRQIEISAWSRAGATQIDRNAYVALTGEA